MKILSPPRRNKTTATATTTCELCNGREAAVYCASDLASLCWSCDAKVHDANFLVARHVRCAICSKCKTFTGIRLSGACFTPSSSLPICPSCCFPSTGSSSSSSSATPSSATSTTTNTITAGNKMHRHSADSGSTIANSRSHADMMKAGTAILVKWCRRLGLPQDHRVHDHQEVVKAALKALRRSIVCWDIIRVPFRVCLAAALWFGFAFLRERRRSLSTWYVRVLRRLQEMSGVPARLISAAESKLDSLFKLSTGKQRPHGPQEGWAETECSA